MTIVASANLSCALAAVSKPLIYVTDAQAAYRGDLFTVNVNIADVSANLKMISLQFRLRYDTAMLETQSDWVSEGSFMESFGQTFFTSYVADDYVLVGILIMPNATGSWTGPFPTGSGTLATITFEALYPVYEAVTSLSTDLTLDDVTLLDTSITEMSYTVESGTVTFAVPTISVNPPLYIANREGETFSVDVNIEDMLADWRLVGGQFRLQYDATLLEVVDVEEGTFISGYGATFFTSFDGADNVIVGILLRPNATGGYPGPFPQGDGRLATITFQAISQPSPQSNSASSDLVLYDTILLSDSVEGIPHNLVDGEYQISPMTFNPIDVNVETGAIHFRGELTEFTMLVTDFGKPIDPETISTTLYYNGAVHANLSPQRIATGLYRATYAISGSASAGTYTLLVEAEYLNVKGTAIKSFQISSTLANWNARIIDIDGTVGTIETSVGVISADLTAIDARLVSIDNNVVTINTTAGLIQTSVETIRVQVLSIDWDTRMASIQTSLGRIEGYVVDVSDGGLATIDTRIGTLTTKVNDAAGNVGTSSILMYVILVLALIAALGAVISMTLMRPKPT
ncbi:MAG TPA: cohesin domain-containing protein [Candidatus Bathyarchaeia archaeon]